LQPCPNGQASEPWATTITAINTVEKGSKDRPKTVETKGRKKMAQLDGVELEFTAYGLWSPERDTWFYTNAGELFYTHTLGIAIAQLSCVRNIVEMTKKQILANHQRQLAQIAAETQRRGDILLPNVRGDGRAMRTSAAIPIPPEPKLPNETWMVAIIGDDGRPYPVEQEEKMLQEGERKDG
jgi:hypothetical protein